MPIDNTPVCSICIANYNGMGVLADCIESVRKQQGNICYEIIVHDDASSDGSAHYIRTHHPDVILLESRNNVGFCISNNRMVESARGKYILLLNNDATLLPDALTTFLQAAEMAGQPCILGLPQYDWLSGHLIDRGCLLDPFLNAVPNLDPVRNEVGVVAGACLWLPKVLWEELDGFPAWFGSMAEDHYLCCRARLSGYRVICLGKSGFRHHVGRSFGGGRLTSDLLTTNFRRRALSERNKSLAMMVCYPSLALFMLLPFHFMLLVMEGIILSVLKRDSRYWKQIYGPCLSQLWSIRSNLMQTRELVQQSRRISLMVFFSAFVAMPYKLRMLMRYGLPDVS
jgi:GT2 family glycosyltransferase